MSQAVTTQLQQPLPAIKGITLDHPWEWLAKGWRDISAAPGFSLAYGALFMILSALLTFGLVYGDFFFITPPLTLGFFLVAPMLGIGLYQISDSVERGEPVQFCNALKAWRRNQAHLSAMALVLLMVALVWVLAAMLVFALVYDNPVPTWDRFIPEVFLSGNNPGFFFTSVVVGGLMAAATFVISAISIPLLMDRQTDVGTAILTSAQAVRVNWQAMLLWALLIVMLIGIGIVTFYVGLVVAMPLVGHATWHAYRDLVPRG